jgi:hypothetical protein
VAGETTPQAVRQEITAKIEEISVSAAYRQSATDAWREAKAPLVVELTPEPLAHLSFFVDDRELRLARTRQNAAEDLRATAPLTIRFLCRLRPNNRVQDWDAAHAALIALVQQLTAWQPELFDLRWEDGVASGRIVQGDYLVCEVHLLALYYLQIPS